MRQAPICHSPGSARNIIRRGRGLPEAHIRTADTLLYFANVGD
jgi:hypothetical protein